MRRRTSGPRPKLSSDAIVRVLRWHAQVMAFRKAGSVRLRAHQQGLDLRLVIRALLALTQNTESLDLSSWASGLRGPQVRAIVRLKQLYPEFAQNHISAASLAAELGVSRYVIFDCIQRDGRYVRHLEISDRSRPSKEDPRFGERSRLLAAWPTQSRVADPLAKVASVRRRRAPSARRPK